jgi:hypothetical protein
VGARGGGAHPDGQREDEGGKSAAHAC